MSKVTTDMIRNIALIGHSGEGKTSLAEAMLFNAKSIDRLGKVEDGNTTMDFDASQSRTQTGKETKSTFWIAPASSILKARSFRHSPLRTARSSLRAQAVLFR